MDSMAIVKVGSLSVRTFGRMKEYCKLREIILQIKSGGDCARLAQFVSTRACMESTTCVVYELTSKTNRQL